MTTSRFAHSGKVRALCWIVLLALAAGQAWTSRFYASPDGVSYLDLSDAVLTGEWRRLLNAYWSPLYPALVGALRALLTADAYWEFAVVHLLNFLLFAASLAAFEYLVRALRELGRSQWDKPGLASAWGTVGAYALFGALTLIMTPLVLPTPDLLVSAASLAVFGALVRLRYDIDARRSGIVLGLALAVGSLAKSFFIPWAGICIVTAFVARRGRSWRPIAIATALWLVAVLPWTIGLSARYGHVTFGDTGRLTYIWYVNQVETPSGKHMPHAAATPATDSILRGVAVTPQAAGTNPIWYDPARWYTDLHPRFVLSRQIQVFGILVAEYIASLAPVFLVIAVWLIVGGRAGVAEWWRRLWPVVVPAIAALAAYSVVLVTTRYVAPFYVTLTLAVVCGARWPERIPPTRMLLAIGIPLILMVATPDPGRPMTLVNAAVGSVLFVWLARRWGRYVQIAAGAIGGVCLPMFQPSSDVRFVTLLSVVLVLCYWGIARSVDDHGVVLSKAKDPLLAESRSFAALRATEAARFSHLVRRSIVAANAVLVMFVAVPKYRDSLRYERLEPTEPNLNWSIARPAKAAGIGDGARIALVGSPFEAYWVRAAGAQLVGVVPPPRVEAFNALQPDRRLRLYDEFAKAGADFIVVRQANPTTEMDQSWKPVEHIGWVKRLR